MIIVQKPEGLLFENNIPDIVLQKENTEAQVDIVLKAGEEVILQENYKFDADGMITIRQLQEIASAYLTPQRTVVEEKVITTGLIRDFTCEINNERSVVRVISGVGNARGKFLVNQMPVAELSQLLNVGDRMYKFGSVDVDLIITDIGEGNFITFTITVSGDFDAIFDTPIPEGGVSAYFKKGGIVEIPFSVLKCEADMPAGLNAGTFAQQNFLTRLAREKRTATNENEYLSYTHFASYADVVVKYKAVYNLGGVRTEKTGTFLTIAAQDDDCIITFNASLAKLRAIAALPEEYIYQYDIWFTQAATDSNVFSFLVVDMYYRHRKYFVFQNSFGVLETFVATGRADVKKNVEINLANIQGRYRKTTQDFSAETTLSTGFLSAQEMDWMDDLLLSYNVALYTPGISGADEEITLTASDKTDTEANELQAFSFSYRRAKNNHLQFTAAARGIFDPTFDYTFN